MIERVPRDVQIPVVITHDSRKCDVYIPDLNMTVHGDDYVDAIANAILKASAVYFYNLERNVKFELNTTFGQASSMCRDSSQFATYIALVA